MATIQRAERLNASSPRLEHAERTFTVRANAPLPVSFEVSEMMSIYIWCLKLSIYADWFAYYYYYYYYWPSHTLLNAYLRISIRFCFSVVVSGISVLFGSVCCRRRRCGYSGLLLLHFSFFALFEASSIARLLARHSSYNCAPSNTIFPGFGRARL